MTAEEIVRALADDMPAGHADEWHWCGLCNKALAMAEQPETHEPDCLYVAAWLWCQQRSEMST